MILETPLPCFVVHCDQCGASTWPPAQSRASAWDAARLDWAYVQSDGRELCPSCHAHNRTTFAALVRAYVILDPERQFEEYVQRWSAAVVGTPMTTPLPEWLGLTDAEYARAVEDPASLLALRRQA